jgi:hypothetical protein
MKSRMVAMTGACMVMAGTGTSAIALPPSVQPTVHARHDTMFLAGLQWNFGDKTPEAVFGVRHARTDTSSNVVGIKSDVVVPLDGTRWKQPVVRVMGVAGNREVQGELGLGVQVGTWKPVIGAGVQGPFVNGGANYLSGDGLKPYIGLNSLKAPKKRSVLSGWVPPPPPP